MKHRAGRRGDPDKTLGQRRREKRAKVEQSGRMKRLRKRLGDIKRHQSGKQVRGHVASLMESLVIRKKAERNAKKQEQEASPNNSQSRNLNRPPLSKK